MSEPTLPPQSSTRRAIILGALALICVLTVFALGRLGWLPDGKSLLVWLDTVGDSPWGLPTLVVVFCLGAFLGVPQFLLIGAAVTVFGPLAGAFYSWLANMVSGSLTFWTGRLAGEGMFKRYAGKTANRMAAFVGRNAFATSAIVRNVPTGPFLIVNMAFGVSDARYSHFAAGMAIGILPKILLIAFAGQSLFAAFKGNPLIAVVTAIAALAIYALGAVYARRHMNRQRQSVSLIGEDGVDNASKANE